MKTFIFTVLIVFCLAGCVKSGSGVAQPTASSIPDGHKPVPDRPDVVVKESGWQIPGLDGSKTIERTEVKNADLETPKMYVTRYLPKAPKGKQFIIEESFLSEDERRILKVFPYELAVSDLWGYDVEGRKFCYVLRVHPPGIGALNTLRFYDEDGDGRFESLEHPSRFVPSFPRWAR